MIPENFCSCLRLSIGHVWLLNELWLKSYIQKYTLFHVLILIMTPQIRWLKIQTLEYLENGTEIFCEIKKFLTSASDARF